MTETIVLPGFGDIDAARIIAFDDLFAVIQDKYPVSPGYTLIVVRRLASRFQELTSIEKTRLLTWIDWTQQHLATNLSGSLLRRLPFEPGPIRHRVQPVPDGLKRIPHPHGPLPRDFR